MIQKAYPHKGVIRTLTGDISVEELGYCQCHEHLFIDKGKSYEVHSALYMADVKRTIAELGLYKSAGGKSLVDAQPVGCGRMAVHLKEASLVSGINIIASTGFHKLVFYNDNHWIHTKDEYSLTMLYIDEISKGMYINPDDENPSIRIDSKAGVIKVALDSCNITGEYEKLFSAAAKAAKKTGVSIVCHIEKGSDAFQLIKFFTDRGINTEKIILCHLDRAMYDIDYHIEIAKTGVYLEYDTIGRIKYHSDEDEVKLIGKMLENNFEKQILLGLDTTRERLKSYGGEIGLDYIKNVFIDKMLNHGIQKSNIDMFTTGNPQKALLINQPIEEHSCKENK